MFSSSSIHFNSSLLLPEKSQQKGVKYRKKPQVFKCEDGSSSSKPIENNFKELLNYFKGNTEHSDHWWKAGSHSYLATYERKYSSDQLSIRSQLSSGHDTTGYT